MKPINVSNWLRFIIITRKQTWFILNRLEKFVSWIFATIKYIGTRFLNKFRIQFFCQKLIYICFVKNLEPNFCAKWSQYVFDTIYLWVLQISENLELRVFCDYAVWCEVEYLATQAAQSVHARLIVFSANHTTAGSEIIVKPTSGVVFIKCNDPELFIHWRSTECWNGCNPWTASCAVKRYLLAFGQHTAVARGFLRRIK